MVFMLLRTLFLILLIIISIYIIYNKIIKRLLKKEPLNNAIEDIKTTLDLAKKIPDIDSNELKKAKQKIKDTIKNGDEQ